MTEFLSENRHRDKVAILELELSCCVSEPGDYELSIVHVTHYHGSDVIIDVEDISD